jgi:hypothetical protein
LCGGGAMTPKNVQKMNKFFLLIFQLHSCVASTRSTGLKIFVSKTFRKIYEILISKSSFTNISLKTNSTVSLVTILWETEDKPVLIPAN